MANTSRPRATRSTSMNSWLVFAVALSIAATAAFTPVRAQDEDEEITIGTRGDTTSDIHHVRTILLDVFQKTGGLDWEDSTNWLQRETSVCTWHGIRCYTADTTDDDRRIGHVQRIDLSHNALVGTMPLDVLDIPYLQHLNVQNNEHLQMDFVDDSGRTDMGQHITELYISNTQISSLDGIGEHLKYSLQILHATSLKIAGPLPASLFDCTKLEAIYANYNNFDGKLPSEIEKLSNLKELYLYDSSLTGQLPTQLGALSAMRILALGQNSFDGFLPTELEQLTSIQIFSLQRKKGMEKRDQGIGGPLLPFSNWRYAEQLSLEDQQFEGKIPSNFLKEAPRSQRIKIDLRDNLLTGTVPSSLLSKKFLNLFLSNNQITAVAPEIVSGTDSCGAINNWMDGTVGLVGCNAFLCPPQTFAPKGRATPTDSCEPCNGPPNPAWGQVDCDGGSGSGSDPGTVSLTSERQALINMYNVMGGSETWDEQTNWLDLTESACDWYGVDCNSDSSVIKIDLSDNGLTGSPPADLFQQLSNLEMLDLNSNAVEFHFGDLTDATKLTSLDISDTSTSSFDGLEEAVGEGGIAQTLKTLSFSHNLLAAPIPDALYSLTNLERLYMSECRLTGPLSSKIGDLKQLQDLSCGGNKLAGQLPSDFGGLVKLRRLMCAENRFEGTLPPEWDGMSSLAVLALHQNTFTDGGIGGPLPPYPNLSNLISLQLNSNRLNGNLPAALLQNSQKLSDRIDMSLQENAFEGEIPAAWSRFERLFLNAADNKITEIPRQLCGDPLRWMDDTTRDFECDAILCPKDTYSDIGRQSGSAHPCLDCEGGTSYMGSTQCLSTGDGVADTELDILLDLYAATQGSTSWVQTKGWSTGSRDYCNENYYGITCDIGGSVSKIDLVGNELAGIIPTSIYSLPRLRELYLSGNTVKISFDGIENASQLKVLHLSNTQTRSLTGIEQAPALINLNLADNQMQGSSIPTQIFALSGLQELYLNNNLINGELTGDLSKLSNLVKLVLYKNHFTGQIPASLGEMSMLEKLHLAENNFDGTLPTQLDRLSNLKFLSVQREGGIYGSNDIGVFHETVSVDGGGLTGSLPEFSSLANLQELYLGYNSLSGSIPFRFLDGIDDKSAPIKIDLTANRLTGTVPASLTQLDQVAIYLASNHIDDIADGLCLKSQWMDGLVGTYSCDAILCPVGKFNDKGRTVSDTDSCQSCATGTTGHMGSFECLTAGEHQANSERAILEMLYNRMDGDMWNVRINWMDPDVTVCQWAGIGCDSTQHDTITSIQLPRNGLKGTLPNEIFSLPNLKQINLKENDITISFQGVTTADKLEYLDIGGTSTEDLSGIEVATNLKVLRADDIKLSAFPASIFSLSAMEILSLNDNDFESTQSIPSQVQNFDKLVFFACSNCGFVGNLPTWFDSFQQLEYIRLDQNGFTGPIPSQFESVANLKHLDLSDQLTGGDGFNGLSGNLPSFATQKSLVEIYLQHNSLEGPIPTNFLESSDNNERITVDLRSNDLTGGIPTELDFLTDVDFLLADNSISEIPTEICNTNWNDGNTQVHDCNGILCEKGKWNAYGRAVGDVECLPCVENPSDFLGAVSCGANLEHSLLLFFYRSLNGPNWRDDTNWLRGENHCDWFGITCYEDGEFAGLVKEFNLPNNNLQGSFPALNQFKGLTHVDMKRNDIKLNFYGIGNAINLDTLILTETSIDSLAGLSGSKSLTALHLTSADLGGPIPDDIYDMTNLEQLYLSYNQLEGKLSTEIGRLRALKDLYLFSNEISGPIPTEFGHLIFLEHLSLGENDLTGEIPFQLALLPNLEVLSLQKEKTKPCDSDFCSLQPGLEGSIPAFDALPKLKQLFLGYNRLTGPIPKTFLQGIQNKADPITADISHNLLRGEIPEDLADFANLRLFVSGNSITKIPDVLCQKGTWMDGQVEQFGCEAILCPSGTFNQFGRRIDAETECVECTYPDSAVSLGSTECGPVMIDGFDDAGMLFELYDATDGDNWKNNEHWRDDNKSFCDWHGITCEAKGQNGAPTVTAIELDDNNLNGIIPSLLFHLPELRMLSVRKNPVEIGFRAIDQAPKLEEMYLDDTNVDDLDGIGNAPDLKKLSLQRNKFLGSTIPDALFSISSLTEIDLTDSYFIGSLSTKIGDLVNLESLVLAGNAIQGSIPSEIGNAVKLRVLDLSRNNFYGTLPTTIAKLAALERFNIENTSQGRAGITGPLRSFNTMGSLQELNLAENQLTGEIPSDFLSGVDNPDTADLTVHLQGNHLIGTVPSTLVGFKKLSIELSNNLFTALGDNVCDQPDWLGGDVGSFGCDGLMCPPGEFNNVGRQTSANDPCKACPGAENSPYYGMSECASLEKKRERDILQLFYSATGGDGWKNNDGWLDDAIDICSWYGISCRDGQTVESIILGSNSLTGKPPRQLFGLKNLQNLWLYSNPMNFSFDGIAEATSLKSLLLDSTRLDSLEGIGGAANLVDLDVRFNNLAGKIPDEILGLKHVETLSFADNGFTGTVPSFAQATKLKTLRMGGNKLKDTIPSFATSQLLTTVDLSDNDLFGTIPRDFLKKIDVSATVFLDLSGNDLTGQVPKELSRFDDMIIYLRDNRIEGIDPELCEKSRWNGGDVGSFKCDGLLCPSGSFSPSGRTSRAGATCEPCPKVQHFGSTSCDDKSGATQQTWMGTSAVLSAIGGLVFACLVI